MKPITAQQCVSATSYLNRIALWKFQKKKKNIIKLKTMVYFFVDKNGTEGCSNDLPNRNFTEWVEWVNVYGECCTITYLPKGTIEKVIGKTLTWEDEPYYYSGIKEIDDLNNK